MGDPLIQVFISIIILAAIIQATEVVSSNLASTHLSLQAKSARFSTHLNVTNALGIFEFCRIALGGQRIKVNDYLSHQPVQIFTPDSTGSRGERIAAPSMTTGPLTMSEVSLRVLRSSGSNHLAQFTLRLSPNSTKIPLLQPLQLKLMVQGTPDSSGFITIQSCRTSEEWTQLGNMKSCGAGEIVAGFNPNGTLICQTGPPGPPGPAGAGGAANCPASPPAGVVSVCVPDTAGGTTWVPF